MLEIKFYKNWKEICNIMNWKTIGGNYKKSKLKELESICKFRKVGHGFNILEIYDKPKEIIDMRGKTGNSSIFIDDISDLILYECSKLNKKDYYFIDLSSSMLSLKLGMINLNYIDSRFYKKKFSIKYNIPKDNLELYYKNIRDRNTGRIISALNKLMSQGLIVWNWGYNIKHNNNSVTIATDKEISYILDAQNYILENDEMFKDCNKDMRLVYINGYAKFFFEKVKLYLIELGFKDIDYYYKTFHIITSKKFKKIALENKDEIKKDLNQKIINSFLEKFKDDIEDAKIFADLCLNTDCNIEIRKELSDIKIEENEYDELNLEDFEELLNL